MRFSSISGADLLALAKPLSRNSANGMVGMRFVGGPVFPSSVGGSDGLWFVKNPNPMVLEQSISPFHHNIIRNSMVEWNIELVRFEEFKHLPCRLHALFLLNSREDAER
jgi:hypothetical protein